MTAIYRYEVPVDNHWHSVEVAGEIVHVATRSVNKVEIWSLGTFGDTTSRTFRVYGGGQELPESAQYVGTAIAKPMVWHLFEKP